MSVGNRTAGVRQLRVGSSAPTKASGARELGVTLPSSVLHPRSLDQESDRLPGGPPTGRLVQGRANQQGVCALGSPAGPRAGRAGEGHWLTTRGRQASPWGP